jgi:hypothetical protein
VHFGTFDCLGLANGVPVLRVVIFGHDELIPSALARRFSIGFRLASGGSARQIGDDGYRLAALDNRPA